MDFRRHEDQVPKDAQIEAVLWPRDWQNCVDALERENLPVAGAQCELASLAMAAGSPIIALKKAGILDTVKCINSKNRISTGLLFNHQSYNSLVDCINYFEEKKLWLEFSSEDINLWAQNFSIENFKNKFSNFIEKSLSEFKLS